MSIDWTDGKPHYVESDAEWDNWAQDEAASDVANLPLPGFTGTIHKIKFGGIVTLDELIQALQEFVAMNPNPNPGVARKILVTAPSSQLKAIDIFDRLGE